MAPTPVTKSYPCNQCTFEAGSSRQLSRHKAIAHVPNPITCQLCPFVTAYQTNLLRHRREVHGICGSKGNKSCKFCGYTSEDNETLIRHQWEAHRDILKTAQLKFAKEKLSASGEGLRSVATDDGKDDNSALTKDDVTTNDDLNEKAVDENDDDNEDDDKDFWKEGFLDDTPNIFMNLANFNQSKDQQLDQSTLSWYSSEHPSPNTSNEGSISEFISSRSSTPKLNTRKMAIAAAAAADDLPATRIRRQYTCNDCGFRTVNPREFLYHRRDSHGQRLKIVECPYCVYACQYVQKLQRHLLLVHKLETSMTPPPEVSDQQLSPSRKLKDKLPLNIHSESEMSSKAQSSNDSDFKNTIPRIRVKLPAEALKFTANPKSEYNSDLSLPSATVASPKKKRTVSLPQKTKPTLLFQRQVSKQRKLTDKRKHFKCNQCGYFTNLHYLYKKHMKYHSSPKIKCNMCDFESPYSWNVDRHLKSHFSNGLHRCTKCSFACDKKQALTVHITQHHRDAKQQLNPLNQGQEQSDVKLNTHDNNGTDNGEAKQENKEEIIDNLSLTKSQMRSPTKCLTTFVRQTDGRIVAKPGVPKKCKYCQFQTDTFAKLQKHETTVHPEKRFQCPLCEIKFENLVWLQRHLSHMHQEDTKASNISHVIGLVNPKRKKPNKPSAAVGSQMQAVASESTSVKHNGPMNAQSTVNRKTTQCHICGYQTRWISELEKHMRVHTNERPFICPYCSFKCKWKGDLNRHIQKYHSRSPMPDLNAMEQHMQINNAAETHHDNDVPEENYRQNVNAMDFEDDYDDENDNVDELKMDETPLPEDYEERPLVFDDIAEDDDEENDETTFEDRAMLMSLGGGLNATSSEVKPGKVKMYRCSYCDFICSTASRFHVHFVQHLNTKPFQCSVCGHRSNWEWDVTKHIKMKSQRDTDHGGAKPILVHESGRRNYAKYNQYVVWMNEKEVEASCVNGSKIDFRAKRSKMDGNDMPYDEGDMNSAIDADYEDQMSSNNEDLSFESIVITPDICFAVPVEESITQSSGASISINQFARLQPNVPYNSTITSGVSPQADDVKCLRCSYCDFKHKESKVMVSHLSGHAGMKPYCCKLCGFDSNWKEVVVRHCIARHSGSSENVETRFRCAASKSVFRIVDESGIAEKVKRECDEQKNQQLENERRQQQQQQMIIQEMERRHQQQQQQLYDHIPESVRMFRDSHQNVKISGFKGSFTCELCPFRAEKAFHMDFHTKRHQPSSGPYKCSHCPYWVNAKKSLVKHMLLHEQSSSKRHNTNEEETETDAYNAVSNVEAVYDDESENELVICTGDDVTEANRMNAYNFSMPRQSASLSKNRCDDCPFIAGTKTQLLYHKQFHRPNRNAYKCTHCTYSVSYLHLLNQHMKVHQQSSGDIQPAQYPTINDQSQDDSFNDDDSHESDIPFTYVQTGNGKRRLFQCRFCPTTSKRRTYIYVHEQMHTKNSNENFKCSNCQFMTKDSSEFLAHLNIHRPDTSIGNDSTKDDASKQTYSTSSVSVIDVNNIRHGNRRMFSYVCPDCPAAFKSPGDLKIHSVFHGSIHLHPCPYCNYRAKNKPQLCKHLYVHTAEYIAKRANSYPEGTKLLIGDAVDHIKRDLCTLNNESVENYRNMSMGSSMTFQASKSLSLLKPQMNLLPQEVHSIRKSPFIPFAASSPINASPYMQFPTQKSTPKKNAFASIRSRVPFDQMIIIEMTETKSYIQKLMSNLKHRFIYNCPQCPAAFIKVNTLRFHVTLHDGDGQIKCDVCTYRNNSFEYIMMHQQLHKLKSSNALISNVYNHRCERCPATFSKKSRLEKHQTLHGLNAKWKCDKCDYAVHYAATLVKHRACHEINPNFQRCDTTDEDQSDSSPPNSQKSIIGASMFKTPQMPPLLMSSVCEQIQNNVQLEEKILFCCDRCPYTHHRKDSVQSHQKRHESSSRDGKRCQYCDYTCLQTSYLRDHINWHFEPPHDRKPIAFTPFEEIEIWKYVTDDTQEHGNEQKELFFKDLGINVNIRERFMPYEDDEEFFELYNGIEDVESEAEDEDDDLEDDEKYEDLEAQENEIAQVLLQMKSIPVDNSSNGNISLNSHETLPQNISPELSKTVV